MDSVLPRPSVPNDEYIKLEPYSTDERDVIFHNGRAQPGLYTLPVEVGVVVEKLRFSHIEKLYRREYILDRAGVPHVHAMYVTNDTVEFECPWCRSGVHGKRHVLKNYHGREYHVLYHESCCTDKNAINRDGYFVWITAMTLGARRNG